MKARTRLLLTGSCAALALTASSARAEEDCLGRSGGGAVKLTVEIHSLSSPVGEVAVTVYPDDRRRFLARKGKLLRARVAAKAPITRACFWLPPGAYAVAVYHDRNADHDFNRTPLGRPSEGYGFSNDAPARLGLPTFESARFHLPPAGRTISVWMRYQR